MVSKVLLAPKTLIFFGASKDAKLIFCNSSVLYQGVAIFSPGLQKVESAFFSKKKQLYSVLVFSRVLSPSPSPLHRLLSPAASLNKRWKITLPPSCIVRIVQAHMHSMADTVHYTCSWQLPYVFDPSEKYLAIAQTC